MTPVAADDDEERVTQFLVALSLRPRSMCGDPGWHRALREQVVPLLRTYPFVNVWHPCCSTGEQVYGTAIVLREEGLFERTRIYATDASEAVLERAARGVYAGESLVQAAPGYLAGGGKATLSEYYTERGDEAVMRPLLRDRVTFGQHNLLTDASFNEFHLIVCPDVLARFDPARRARVFQLFHSSLCRFGLVYLGRTEGLEVPPPPACYEELPECPGLYRWTAAPAALRDRRDEGEAR